jgi:hypothetical protein
MDIFIFTEEEPPDEVLEKLRLVTFPLTLVVAAHNPEEFAQTRRRILEVKPDVKLVLWPTFFKASSHWLSPLSNRHELRSVERWLRSLTRDDVAGYMLDLELPTVQPWMFVKNLPHFFGNRKLLKEMMEIGRVQELEVYTAEYPAIFGRLMELFKKIAGVTFSSKKYGHVTIPMWYSSMLEDYGKKMHMNIRERSFQHIRRQVLKGKPLCVGVGVTMPANLGGSTSVLSPEDLSSDIYRLRNIGVSAVAVYHLGGMTPQHFAVCEAYAGSIT